MRSAGYIFGDQYRMKRLQSFVGFKIQHCDLDEKNRRNSDKISV